MDDSRVMARALALGESVRGATSPNPWVGCVVVAGDGWFEGVTSAPGGPHAEASALAAAGARARGATLYVTLEPCAHTGRTGPCADAIVAAGVARAVVAIEDPDSRVAGRGLARLRDAGVGVTVGVGGAEAAEQLAPYLKHRRTGRPWVVLKLAATLDGRIAAPDGTSRWITGGAAREDAHRLRAGSDAVLVGAGTVRADDPALTVRLAGEPVPAGSPPARQPLRVVLGRAPAGARVQPALELGGDLGHVLDELGRRDVLQVLVEGGAGVAHAFHAAGLVDRYVLYLAPAIMGGSDGRPLFAGPGAPTMADLWRGRLVSVERLGEDLRVEVAPASAPAGRAALPGGAALPGEAGSVVGRERTGA
ncbi:MAG: bifunctional diaminohydroxyphosphoribosylaminopyrimidine deaminase/5-amino-6-(5-phosphoribosylamino)uracil reductase RibD [Acidimicrobiales bacterium]